MAKRTKEIYLRKRKPIIALICEGRNKTESKYFSHFNSRENPYNLYIYPSEATDPLSMAKKAKQIIKDNDMDSSLGDRVFCLIDLDLSSSQFDKVNAIKKSQNAKCPIEVVISNPCFEIWLLYYFTDYPKVETSSQNVKNQLKKFVPQYSENFDIVKEYNLQDKFGTAINRADKRNHQYSKDMSILEKNPYTEVDDLVTLLLTLKDKED